MRFFGQRYNAPMYEDCPEIETPVGALCRFCSEAIEAGDDGLQLALESGYTHRECFLRGILGGVNHIEGRCFCCGGSERPDPPGVSRREAARLAIAAWNRKHGVSA